MRPMLLALTLAACGGAPATTDAGDLTSGTLAVERLPEEVVLSSELSSGGGVSQDDVDDAIDNALDDVNEEMDDIHDAVQTVGGRVDDVEARLGGVAGVTVPDFDSNISLDSTTSRMLAEIVIGPAPQGAVLSSNVSLEKSGASTGRYELTIREGTCSGTIAAKTLWRPGTVSESYNSDVVALNAFVASVPTATTFVLCGRKFDDTAPTANAGPRSLVAHW